MAATVRSFSTNTNNGSSSTFTVVTGTAQVGDVLLAIHGNDFYTHATLTAPTAPGLTFTESTAAGADGGTNFAHVKVWWAVVASAGAKTVTFNTTGTADEEKGGIVYVLQGADNVNPIDAAQGTATQTLQSAWVAAACSPTSSDALLIGHWNAGGGGTVASFTLSGGSIVEQYELHDGGEAAVGGYETLSASGSTGTRTATTSGEQRGWAGTLVAIKAGAAAASGPDRLPFMRAPGRFAPAGQWSPFWVPSFAAINANAPAENAAGTGQAFNTTIKVAPAAGNAAGTGTASSAALSVSGTAGSASGTGAAGAPTPNVGAAAGNAAGTGTAYDATVTGSSNASAGNAAGTGSANTPTVAVTASAGNASGTGAAAAPTLNVGPAPGAASGAGAAGDITGASTASAGAATGIGAAGAPAANVQPTAGNAAGTGSAGTPAVNVGAAAGVASGAGSAGSVSDTVTAIAGVAAGTGAAYDATVNVAAPRPSVIVVSTRRAAVWDYPGTQFIVSAPVEASAATTTDASAGNAAGTGTANQPTLNVAASAGNAAGTGAAAAPAIAVAAAAGAASGTGAAGGPTPNVGASAGSAAGTGTAGAATVQVVASAGAASGVGIAQAPTANVAASAGNAAGTGTAYQPTVSVPGSTNASAGNAAGTGAAGTPTVTVTATAGAATGTAAAGAPTINVGAAPSAATGVGSAGNATASVSGTAGSAAGTGSAGNATASVSASAGAASGTGSAAAPTTAVAVTAGLASGTGTAHQPNVDNGNNTSADAAAGHASGVGNAYRPTIRITTPGGVAAAGWAGLKAILAQPTYEPVNAACPNDGEPYRLGPGGVLYCPFDGYQPGGYTGGGGHTAPATGSTGADWGGLAAVTAQARTLTAPARLGSHCPNDGTLLETGPEGVLFCRFDGWTGTPDEAEPAGASVGDYYLPAYTDQY